VSPVAGWTHDNGEVIHLALEQASDGAKVCLVKTQAGGYGLSVEGDLLFEPRHVRAEEVADLVARVTRRADALEQRFRLDDHRYAEVQRELSKESRHATHQEAAR
jgi:hypothetical protein